VARGSADAAAISSYAVRLAEACEAVSPGELRIIGATRPLPFIRAFATDALPQSDRAPTIQALQSVSSSRDLRLALESRDGFVPLDSPLADDWSQWRGQNESGVSASVPPGLPEKPQILWHTALTGPGFSGVCISDHYVVVADKSPDGQTDIWRCLDSETGRQIWQFTQVASGVMDFTNAPRAMPVARDGRVYVLNAFGNLHCLDLYRGIPLWQCDLVQVYGGRLPTWGFASTPLLDERGLICQTASAEHALVCLDPATGKLRWALPGVPMAYASPIHSGERVLGLDESGVFVEGSGRLQRLTWPTKKPEWIAATPLALRPGRVLISSFGSIALLDTSGDRPRILDENTSLGAGTSSPVAYGELVFVAGPRRLSCLRVTDRIELLWQKLDDRFADHASLIMGSPANSGRPTMLAVSASGHVMLVAVDESGYHELATTRLLDADGADTEAWSHPAIVAGRLYLRSSSEIVCLKLH
jgi:outer membrane protein assembly factor BamB